MIKRKIEYFCIIFSLISLSFLLVGENINEKIIENKVKILIDEKPNQFKYHCLEIPSLHLKQVIIKGMTQTNLDKNYITTNDDLLSNDSIILAGHNRKGVFRKLYNIQLGDFIYIDHKKKYKVVKKEMILNTEVSKLSHEINSLNLITCSIYPKKRLLVIAILQDEKE